MGLDYLFVGAHPDDCEISCGGTILHLKSIKQKVGVLDLSEGELGTYGDRSIRRQEKERASKILGLDYRECLSFPDGRIENTISNKEKLVSVIRRMRPEIVVSFSAVCRHPDHHYTHLLVKDSVFLAGLSKYQMVGHNEAPHRPFLMTFNEPVAAIDHPNLVIDISPFFQQKIKAIKCFSSQVKVDEKASDQNVKTLIKSGRFWQRLRSKNSWYGALIDVEYGEGFFVSEPLKLVNPMEHLQKRLR